MNWIWDTLNRIELLTPGAAVGFGLLLGGAFAAVVVLRGLRLSRIGWCFVLGVPTVIAVGAWLVCDVVWLPFNDPFGWTIWGLLWVGIFIPLAALWPRLPLMVGLEDSARARVLRAWPVWKLGRKRTAFVITVVILVSTAGMFGGMNWKFGVYRTAAALFGNGVEYHRLSDVPQTEVSSPVPRHGMLVRTDLIGEVSGWHPRPAVVYLPPAYQHAYGQDLPVLVLMAGQPGAPESWVQLGEMQTTLDAYAARHDGRAPVVVVADQLGSGLKSPLCSDSPVGNVATYLQEDVPNWIEQHLNVTHDRSKWGIGGLSNGATCALQVVTRAPDAYSIILNMSGEAKPEVSGNVNPVDQIFGGDQHAYDLNNPAHLMEHRKYPQVRGVFSVGQDDSRYRGHMKKLYQSGVDAGMDLQFREYPGGHSWRVWRPAFADQLEWFGQQTGLA